MKLSTLLLAAFTCLAFGNGLADDVDLNLFNQQDRLGLEMLEPRALFSSSEKSQDVLNRIKSVKWLALYDGPSGRLQRKSIRFKHLNLEAGVSGPEFEAEVVGSGPKPLMLLQPYPGLRSGPVTRWLGATSLNDITEDHPLQVRETTKIVLERAPGEPSTAPGATTTPCRLVLISNRSRQMLDHPFCSVIDGKLGITSTDVSIKWAGDLDHDGIADFIFAISEESSFDLLALSSAANDHEAFRIVQFYRIPDWC